MTVESHEVVVKILGTVPDYAECEIVRCRDCRLLSSSTPVGVYCMNFNTPLYEDYNDGFCAWGERKDN